MAVYKRGKVWYYDIQVGGRRIKRATKATDKRGAEFEAALKLRELSSPTATTDTGMTLRQAIMRCYKEQWAKNKDGLRTVNRTLRIVDILGDIPLRKVDELAINRMTNHLITLNREPATLNRYRANLRKVLNVAYREWREIERVPFIKNTREIQRRFKVYTAEEEARILDLPEEYKDFKDLTVLLLDTGMRLGEAIHLARDRVDFRTNLITIRATETKGAKTRSIPMTRRVREVLGRRVGNPKIFPFANISEVENLWRRKIKVMLGVPPDDEEWVIHAMRHTFASRLVSRGVDLYTVKELLGHSTITVTERYAHLNPDKLHPAVAVLDHFDDV